jgi:transposase-like protein
MAKRRQWKAAEKSRIILEGLKGRPVADICVEYQISQSMYYSWRDQFLSNMGQVFETKKIDQREAYQNRQIDKMKKIIADLTIELKKSDEDEWSS